MKQYVTDIEGTQIEVTHLPEAIKQAEMFSKFDVNDVERTKYWKHLLGELQNLKPLPEVKPIVKEEKEDELSYLVRKIREERMNSRGATWEKEGTKLFIKDCRPHLYGAWACVKTDRYFRKLDALKVGESTENGGGRMITRVF